MFVMGCFYYLHKDGPPGEAAQWVRADRCKKSCGRAPKQERKLFTHSRRKHMKKLLEPDQRARIDLETRQPCLYTRVILTTGVFVT